MPYSSGFAPLESPRVLVVDDDHDTASALRRALELDGYEVAVSHDADEALSAAEAFRPMGVLMDLGLPHKESGLRLARILQQRYGSTMVIIVLTGHSAHPDIAAALQAGADKVLTKPIDFDVLRGLLPPAPGPG